MSDKYWKVTVSYRGTKKVASIHQLRAHDSTAAYNAVRDSMSIYDHRTKYISQVEQVAETVRSSWTQVLFDESIGE